MLQIFDGYFSFQLHNLVQMLNSKITLFLAFFFGGGVVLARDRV